MDTHALHRSLMHDPTVEYVRFSLHADCADARGHLHQSCVPCTPHASSRVLHRTHRWLDRPHFATWAHYAQRLFSILPSAAKVTPEQLLDQTSRDERDWPLWIYGHRGDMARDLHWPTLVDGKRLVAKEYVAELRRKGHNVSYSYARVLSCRSNPSQLPPPLPPPLLPH